MSKIVRGGKSIDRYLDEYLACLFIFGSIWRNCITIYMVYVFCFFDWIIHRWNLILVSFSWLTAARIEVGLFHLRGIVYARIILCFMFVIQAIDTLNLWFLIYKTIFLFQEWGSSIISSRWCFQVIQSMINQISTFLLSFCL